MDERRLEQAIATLERVLLETEFVLDPEDKASADILPIIVSPTPFLAPFRGPCRAPRPGFQQAAPATPPVRARALLFAAPYSFGERFLRCADPIERGYPLAGRGFQGLEARFEQVPGERAAGAHGGEGLVEAGARVRPARP